MTAPLPPASAPGDENQLIVQPILRETEADYKSPGERKLEAEKRAAWRVAAILILLNTLLNVGTFALGLGGPTSSAILVGSVIDVILAINLFRDRKWARDWAVIRLLLGLVVYAFINGASGGITAVLATVFIVGSILLVLIGEPCRWRTIVGSVIFLITFLVLMAGLAITAFATRTTGLSVDSMNLLNEARAALDNADYPTAVRLYGELTRAEPDSAIAFYGLCSAYQESGNGSLAIRACDTAAELAPDDSNILSYRAFVLLNLRRYEEALAQADRAVTINNRDYFGHFIRGAARFALGEEGYQEDFAKGLALAPTESERAAFQEAITEITGE